MANQFDYYRDPRYYYKYHIAVILPDGERCGFHCSPLSESYDNPLSEEDVLKRNFATSFGFELTEHFVSSTKWLNDKVHQEFNKKYNVYKDHGRSMYGVGLKFIEIEIDPFGVKKHLDFEKERREYNRLKEKKKKSTKNLT